MINEAQLAANRANARFDEPAVLSEAKTQERSTGPKSDEAKTNCSRDGFKHGLYSKQLVVGTEQPAELDALKAKLRAEHLPVNETEEILVDELAEQFWRLRRARIYEASMLDSGEVLIPHLTAIQRMMSSAERGFHKALTALRQLQKDRGFVPQKQESGFVPQSNQNPECERGVKLTADRCELTANSGFVPPPCPADEEIDPADWARAFEARHRVHTKLDVK